MFRTITTNSAGLTVSDADDPVLVAATRALVGADINPGLLAVPIAAAWQIDDEGAITAAGPYGLALLSAGTVSVGLTTAVASISGAIAGIVAAASATTIVNDASINGTGLGAIWLQAGGTIDNGNDAATAARPADTGAAADLIGPVPIVTPFAALDASAGFAAMPDFAFAAASTLLAPSNP